MHLNCKLSYWLPTRMFNLHEGLCYWLYSHPTDMRKSFYTLSGLVTNKMHRDPNNGEVFIFLNKRRTRLKLLRMEPGGLVIYSKMLEVGTFPCSDSKEESSSRQITWADLVRMVEGIANQPGNRLRRLKRLKTY